MDSAAGIASVVTDEPTVLSTTDGETITAAPAAATPETEVSPNAVSAVDAADVTQAGATSTGSPITEGGA